ncbi:glycosyltransferase family 2 protein [Polaribacter sp. 20A6]|uniref:glycosyltransferase family 2 protein n=1 Tax=Polaribacter sp. 20A6 TaxID=2687289 RepID=UPI0013FDC7F2|nr:glycosyltransferase family 2 protein [Polaribacter sp. 20A6]
MLKEASFISIIIPTYNRAHIISETLNSIIAQTYTNWECIVIDDGSNDNTTSVLSEYIKKDNRFQYHKRPSNRCKGANSCRNYGFEISKGNYIQWFDSDDLLDKNAFENYIKGIVNGGDLIVAPIKVFRNNLDFISEIKVFSNNLIEDYLVGNVSFLTGAAFWNRSFLNNQKEMFDETLGNLDDWDFNLRMLYQNPKIKVLKMPLMLYRAHENSLSYELDKLNLREIKSEFIARKKHEKILKEQGINAIKLTEFIIFRHKIFLRMALVSNSEIKYYLFKETLKKQIENYKFYSFFKTLIFTLFYLAFNKGYKYL